MHDRHPTTVKLSLKGEAPYKTGVTSLCEKHENKYKPHHHVMKTNDDP